jgi:hypothetical protein
VRPTDRRTPFCAQSLLTALAVLVAALPALGQTTSPLGEKAGPASTRTSGTFTLRQGTEVKLRFAKEISSKTAVTGDILSLTLDEDLQVGDAIVARAGATAVGTVSKAKKAGMMGKGGELDIQLDFLQVGDHKIKLRGTKNEKGQGHRTAATAMLALGPIGMAAGGMMHGENRLIDAGAPLVAYVDEDTPLPPDTSLSPVQARAVDRMQAVQTLIKYQSSIVLGFPPDIFSVFRDCGHDAGISGTEATLGLGALRQTPLRVLSMKLTGFTGAVIVGSADGPLATLTFNQRTVLASVEFMNTLTSEEEQKAQTGRMSVVQASDLLRYVKKLQTDGGLPGFQTGEEGQATFDHLDETSLAYPISLRVMLTKKTEPGISYSYTFTKISAVNADWSLQAASKLGVKGEKISDLLPK